MTIHRFLASIIVSTILCLGGYSPVSAQPAGYGFSADPVPLPGSDPILAPLLASCCLAPEGTFTYDNSVAVTGTEPEASVLTGATIYSGAITNLVGSVNGFNFSDPSGRALVGDDRLEPLGLTDVLALITEPEGASTLVGFEIGGYTLVSVSLAWIEGRDVFTDFLSNQNLPTVLPAFEGQIRFEFALISDPTVRAFVRFGMVETLNDTDGDGIEDAIDGTLNGVFNDQSIVRSNDFTDQHLAGFTFGTIVDRSDLLFVEVTDHPTLGVILVVEEGTGAAQFQMCTNPVANIFLTHPASLLATCGSFTGEALEGLAVVTIGTITITIPAGAIALLEELPGSGLSITSVGDGSIVIDDGEMVTILAPGDTPVVIPDEDNDGVPDDDDVCLATTIPEAAPTTELKSNRWTLQDANRMFTQAPPQARSKNSFTTTDTLGCSCEQITELAGLGNGHLKFGCSTSVMLDWVNNLNNP